MTKTAARVTCGARALPRSGQGVAVQMGFGWQLSDLGVEFALVRLGGGRSVAATASAGRQRIASRQSMLMRLLHREVDDL